MAQAKLIFITGGVRSGKSSFAESLATSYAEKTSGRLHYIACGQAADHEMEERIRRHQLVRQNSPIPWKTWECFLNLGTLASHFTKRDVVLLDCVTTLLDNELFSHYETGEWQSKKFQNHVEQSIVANIAQLKNNSIVTVVVSNELLNEPIHEETSLTYGRLLGSIHQQIVKMADEAFLVEAGIHVLMKGERLNE
ncbi:bifunctional adenosylcobinamide kinase/adenosylcobinamide-phosphate guanylyltransferase [Bacillus aquiflavi]|uniref:Adenosylcobinamide kinase n=1 Tax=Bacillus aquiflavi TaxID=2672567 RepID=A0A6B3VSH5_9BACI|nr:bifunctional adenosylcobinamide kinase/adenosylcobinamide-phosphate guanylyltransferase [Bacillus aquiflavi]MBA4536853.1 bifunctional adenosylcobinamide kinase/adenosylcobinamide-phosphate guanylyltransferase [Bacillus aquiflavi]NEY81220.1 bifunctional adenosylcobinamide kinase/adenosylcobinamide-phosphate guanylyltransferase [Bacillus aquiflavi]UAC48472.1 bifunctional adenosylcobinamide kinase/adenosylcobinamide-phosphate guanylyltransferase [Bacillus aquiflavi]